MEWIKEMPKRYRRNTCEAKPDTKELVVDISHNFSIEWSVWSITVEETKLYYGISDWKPTKVPFQ